MELRVKLLSVLGAFLYFLSTGCGPSEKLGLEKRPNNTSCLSSSFPSFVEDRLTLEDAFPQLQFERPTAMVQAPGDNSSWYILENSGRVYKFSNDSHTTEKELFLDIRQKIITGSEGSLIGIAFPPDYSKSKKVYIFYNGFVSASCTNAFACPSESKLSSFVLDPSEKALDPASEETLLSIQDSWGIHAAGTIHFGQDGYLYISTGDGGGSWINPPEPQDTFSYQGKILRIDVSQSPYQVPAENPFVGGGGLSEVYAYGFRNPWKWSFDRLTGDLWVGDVGLYSAEEVSLVQPGPIRNYGWPIYEGEGCLNGPCDPTKVIFPKIVYSHNEGCAVIGGYVYRGSQIPNLYGTYLYGDFCTGRIWGYHNSSSTSELLAKEYLINPSSFTEDQNGELFLIGVTDGRIYKLTHLKEPVQSVQLPPLLLSQTGCFEKKENLTSKEGLIPYDINMPFWSDGAKKSRWMALPDGQSASIKENGKWIFPIGTVLIKQFEILGKKIETRFLVQDQKDHWSGYTYRWREDQTEADLVGENGDQIALSKDSNWYYPGRKDCIRCHTPASGRVLGIENQQLDGLFTYPSGIQSNQFETLRAIGVVSSEFDLQHSVFPKREEENIVVGEKLNQTARAYLHVNCAQCHQPNGPTGVSLDFRSAAPLQEMNLCNVPSQLNSLKRLSPGKPEESFLLERMKSTLNPMPPLGRQVVDAYGVQLMETWIRSLEGCN